MVRLPCCLGPFWGCCLFASYLFGESISGATDFGDFLTFRCLFRFLPAVKATDFAGFPFFRCLFPLHKPRKASDFGDFSVFRCLFHFLPAVKATDFAGFPFFRCLLATILTQEIFNSSFLFSHAIDSLMHFLKKLVVAQVFIRHFAKPRPETQ